MDFGALAQKDKLKPIAKKNHINVDNVCGYRLMKNEKPITEKDIDDFAEQMVFIYMQSKLGFGSYPCDNLVDEKKHKLFLLNMNNTSQFNWKKRNDKFGIHLKGVKKRIINQVKKQTEIFNKYCGQNVLYIHAQLGKDNIYSNINHLYYNDKDWYLDSCDDTYDSEYCDIYAKIKD